MTPKQEFYEKQAATIIKNLEKRGMEGYYCANSVNAVEKVMGFFTKSSVITWGGSMTLTECGLMDALNTSGLTLLDRSTAKTPAETKNIYRQAFAADYYLMSANAVTLDGEIINVDGTGNRIAALAFGPDHVVLLVGMNKVTTDVASAIERVHTLSAPPNAMRIQMNTPCAKTGICAHCISPECICAQTSIVRYNRHKGRIKVILIGETLGY